MNERIHTKEQILTELREMITVNEKSIKDLEQRRRASKEVDAYLENRNPVLSTLSNTYNPDYRVKNMETEINMKKDLVKWAKKMIETYGEKGEK